jgi:DNA polymerase III epsilon subunit-like protein
MGQSIADTTFTFLDFETTGMNPTEDDITEIAAIKVKNGQVLSRFTTLVKPEKTIPPNVEAITRISNGMVQNAPPLSTALPQLVSFIGPSPILVGDFLDFDLCQLKDKLPKHGLSSALAWVNREDVFCTRAMGVRLKENGQSALLRQIKNALPTRPKHRAENDVLNASDLMFGIVRAMPELQTLSDLANFQGEALVYRGQ